MRHRIAKPFVVAAFGLLVSASAALAELSSEIRAVYGAFLAAQNDRDPERIRAFFTDDADFLWVSDGRSFWGADAVIARMSRFQRADVWRVEPNLDRARVVALGADAAMMHFTLTLVIGGEAAPNRLGFIVSILFRRVEADWRIAALLTTRDNQQ